MRLKDKIAIVTGASRGIGKFIALSLAKEGALAIINFKEKQEKAQEVLDNIKEEGGRGEIWQTDVTSWEKVKEMMDDIYLKYGRIDILVNNAGTTMDNLILDMSKDDWDMVINTNLGSVFNCVKAVAQYMILQKSGRIINISSISGERGGRGQANYAASKGGINAFTRAAAMELASKGITVNAVAPGLIDTKMSETVIRRAKGHIKDFVALRRPGQPEEVAKVVTFLASDDASYITGEIVKVDGGFRA
ncbi:MAG: 3-oxoacyl-ACP reductase FabG [Thermodesulfobacteriota bacterium]|nr:3-oxoacyl-ACP reductase FabG [Thermodesulfobacteriota bacterium]